MADWSELPNEVCGLIGDKTSVAAGDQIRFRSVCKTWRALVPAPFPQPPWLMLAEDDNNPSRRRFIGLGHHPDGSKGDVDQVYHLELPEAYRTRCLGSTGTWLITIDCSERICLLNPFSRRQIDLPPQPTFQNGLTYDAEPKLSPEAVRDAFVHKVVLSSSPLSPTCVAMAIHHHHLKLAFARPGDPSWTTLQTPKHYFHDIIFYKAQFYGINHHGTLMVCDIGDDSRPPKAIQLNDDISRQFSFSHQHQHYLVEWMGELLYVVKCMADDNVNETYQLKTFEVYTFDFDAKRWNLLKNLGDYSLFLGCNTSVALLASQYPGLKSNCIYFTDDYTYGYVGYEIPGGRVMGVYNMDDGSVQPHYNGTSTSLYSPPLWIIPPNPSATNQSSSLASIA